MLYLKNILLHKKKKNLTNRSHSPERDQKTLKNVLDQKSIIKNIDKKRINIIAEIKKSSPSKGVLNPDLDIAATASIYERHKDLIAAVSVITEELYFGGSTQFLMSARENTSLPILRKDFIISPYQIYESCNIGADCVLLISTILGFQKLKRLYRLARDLGMDVLVEVHSKKDLSKALCLGAEIIGINNRDLRNMQINKDNIFEILQEIKADDIRSRTFICESGIGENDMESEIKYMKKVFDMGVRTFLIGSYFMKNPDIDHALNKLREKLIQNNLA
jgi:indole-3-glycerol phosphate synthase